MKLKFVNKLRTFVHWILFLVACFGVYLLWTELNGGNSTKLLVTIGAVSGLVTAINALRPQVDRTVNSLADEPPKEEDLPKDAGSAGVVFLVLMGGAIGIGIAAYIFTKVSP